MNRYHPAGWPLAVWIALAVLAGLLKVQYTLGGFSFAPAVALLCGTWLGWRKATIVQTAAAAILIPLTPILPDFGTVGDWGFYVGLIASASRASVASARLAL